MKTEQEIKVNKATVEVKTPQRFISSNQKHRHSEQHVTTALNHIVNFAVQLKPLKPDAFD